MIGHDHDHGQYAEQHDVNLVRNDLEHADAHLQAQVWDLKQALEELRLELARVRTECVPVSEVVRLLELLDGSRGGEAKVEELERELAAVRDMLYRELDRGR